MVGDHKDRNLTLNPPLFLFLSLPYQVLRLCVLFLQCLLLLILILQCSKGLNGKCSFLKYDIKNVIKLVENQMLKIPTIKYFSGQSFIFHLFHVPIVFELAINHAKFSFSSIYRVSVYSVNNMLFLLQIFHEQPLSFLCKPIKYLCW